MNRITNVKRRRNARAYESPLRDEQADVTRTKILDALVRTMARGVAGLSVPAVAREAGVSVPTVYRHFGTKASLVAALGPHLFERTGLMEIPRLERDDFGSLVRELYRRNQSLDTEVRAALASQLGQEMRRRTMPQRFALVRTEMKRRVPGLSGMELDRFSRLALLLMSSAMTRAYKDYLDIDAKDAAKDVTWVLETLRRALRRARS
jgi:AcrR family transcriptional regulator